MKFLGRISAAVAVVVLAIFGLAQAAPQVNLRTGERYPFGVDTSDGRYVKFDGPVRGIPAGHGGGRWGKLSVFIWPLVCKTRID